MLFRAHGHQGLQPCRRCSASPWAPRAAQLPLSCSRRSLRSPHYLGFVNAAKLGRPLQTATAERLRLTNSRRSAKRSVTAGDNSERSSLAASSSEDAEAAPRNGAAGSEHASESSRQGLGAESAPAGQSGEEPVLEVAAALRTQNEEVLARLAANGGEAGLATLSYSFDEGPSASGALLREAAESAAARSANDAAAASSSSGASERVAPESANVSGSSTNPSTSSSSSNNGAASSEEPPCGSFRLPAPVGAAVTALAACIALLGMAVVRLKQALTTQLLRFPHWRNERDIRRLAAAAGADPGNAAAFAALLAKLNSVRPMEVLARVEAAGVSGGATAGAAAAGAASVAMEKLSPAVVAEYLKALVATGRISEYADPSRSGGGERHRSMAQLLLELRQRMAGESAGESPGDSIARPLHISLTDVALPSAPRVSPLSTIFGFLWWLVRTVALLGLLSFLCLDVGLNLVRRYSGGKLGGAAPGAAGGAADSAAGVPGAPSLYSPKEYNKDVLPERSVKTFADVKGCPEALSELEEIVEYLKNPDKFTRLGGKLPKGVLLTGPPGTGKTLLARAVAGEAGVPFFFRSGSEFDEMYVGVGSRRVRSLFQAAAKKAPCIVFIDEIDAVGGSRKRAFDSRGLATLNQLLVEMDGFEANEGIIVMAATNLPDMLDAALTRPGRFDRHVTVGLPDVRGRIDILQYYLKGVPTTADVSPAILAKRTPGFSGADLSNLINEAALIAAKEGQDAVTPHMLDEARDKILMGSKRESLVQSQEARRLTAYHESGHALVALNTAGAMPIHKATIVPRGHALGMVSQVPDGDEFSTSRRQMMASIDVCMGGKAAEEIAFGADQVTSGATSDLRQATQYARHMVAECGMSEAIGPIYVDTEGSGPGGAGGLSTSLKGKVDEEVSRMLRSAYDRVVKLLRDKEDQLHRLAAALLEYETLTQADIKQVLAGTFIAPPPAADALKAPEGGTASDVASEEVSQNGGGRQVGEPEVELVS